MENDWPLLARAAAPPRRSRAPLAREPRCAEWILWILRTGAPWADLPARYPSHQTCHRRFQQWVRAGEQWDDEIGRVLRSDKYPIIDLPPEHPIWQSMFVVKELPQMASIQYWRRSGGGISERGEDSSIVQAKGIADAHGRLMVVMVHNSDIPDGWEREAEDPQYFYKFSPDAYSVGIDVVLYALTH